MYLDAIARNRGGGGSGGGVLVVNDVDGTLDKTWQEISDAVVSACVDSLGYIGYAMFVGGNPSQDMYGVEYVFHTDDGTPVISVYVADDPDANPHLMNGGGGEV